MYSSSDTHCVVDYSYSSLSLSLQRDSLVCVCANDYVQYIHLLLLLLSDLYRYFAAGGKQRQHLK